MMVNAKTFSPACLANRFRLVKALMGGQAVVPALPSIVYIESTNRCNLNCIMCPRQAMTRPQQDMPLDLFNAIVDQLDPKRTELVVLHSDGEPLLNPAIFQMIAAAKAKGMATMTSTNATLLDRDTAERLIASGLDILTLSLDGASAPVYETIRRGANFDKVTANIEAFLTLKGKRPPFTVMQMIQMGQNRHEAEAFWRRWRRWRRCNTFPVVKPVTDWFGVHAAAASRFCDRPWFGLVVQSSGAVVPCVHDFNGAQVIGALPTDHIYSLWNGPQMVDLRRTIVTRGRSAAALCRKCNATSPRRFGPAEALGLGLLDMATIAKALPFAGYNRPKQY